VQLATATHKIAATNKQTLHPYTLHLFHISFATPSQPLCIPSAGTALFHSGAKEQLAAFRARDDVFSLGVCNGCQLMALL